MILISIIWQRLNESTSFLNKMYSLSLLPIISKPTRIGDNSATLIDHFFINEPCNFESRIQIGHTNWIGHTNFESGIQTILWLSLITKNVFCTNSSKNVNRSVHYRPANQNTLSALDEMLALTNFDDIISNVNINEAT